MTAELALTGARAGYATVEVLHGVDLEVAAGAVTALVGANGAGKTTLLRVLAGILPLRGGDLRWQGESIAKLTAYERARRGLILVPDERAVFASLTVRENLTIVADAFELDDFAPAVAAFPKGGARRGRGAGPRAGGERRMLALARALLAQPKVLLLDELSLGLAPRVAAELFDRVGQLAREGVTVVLADQYAEQVLKLADVVYLLRRGEVGFAGEPGELQVAL